MITVTAGRAGLGLLHSSNEKSLSLGLTSSQELQLAATRQPLPLLHLSEQCQGKEKPVKTDFRKIQNIVTHEKKFQISILKKKIAHHSTSPENTKLK